MNLNFNRHGTKLFFLTFAVEGRRKVLSKIADETPRPTLTDRYDPSAEDSREIAAGRLAILSDFTDTPAIASRDMRTNPAAAHAFRANCLAMNDLAAKLCEV